MNYSQIEEAIASNTPFTHNGSMTGYIATCYEIGTAHQKAYFIKSYSTIIYEENLETGALYVNSLKYSQTTSRQQNLIKRIKGL